MEWYAILIILGFLVIVLLLDLKIIFFYEHPDDSKYSQGLVAKVTALVGFQLVWLLLTGIPTDAFNTNASGELDMRLFWNMVLPFILIYLILPIPLAISFYEADTDPRTSKTPAWFYALKHSAIVFICCTISYIIMYFALRSTKVLTNDGTTELVDAYIPFFLFSAIFVGLCGWILITLYLSVGLIAVPQGLILGFINRPKPISQQDYK